MQLRTLSQLLGDLLGWETLIGHHDSSSNVVVNDKGTVRCCINAVAWEDFRTNRFHAFQVVCIDYGNVLAPFDPRFAREGRQIVDGTRVLLECAVNHDMMSFLYEADATLVESLTPFSIFAEFLKKVGDRVGR